MQIRDALLPEYDQELANTRKLLERLPDDKFGWKPHDKSMTLGQLSNHLADMTEWLVDTIKKNEFDVSVYKPVPPAATRSELLSKFDKNLKAGRTALSEVSDEAMMANWSLRSGEQIMMTLPRAAVIRTWVFSHLIHHRGQLSVYLRLLDIPVPSIYGPSADEQQ